MLLNELLDYHTQDPDQDQDHDTQMPVWVSYPNADLLRPGVSSSPFMEIL